MVKNRLRNKPLFFSNQEIQALAERIFHHFETLNQFENSKKNIILLGMYLENLSVIGSVSHFKWNTLQMSNYSDQDYPINGKYYNEFPPFISFRPSPFQFEATQIRIYKNGIVVFESKQNTEIRSGIFLDPTGQVNSNGLLIKGLPSEIKLNSSVNFHSSLTQNERIMFFNFPVTDEYDDISMSNIRNLLSDILNIENAFGKPNLRQKELEEGEPYLCSLFYSENELVKISFNVLKPNILVELIK